MQPLRSTFLLLWQKNVIVLEAASSVSILVVGAADGSGFAVPSQLKGSRLVTESADYLTVKCVHSSVCIIAVNNPLRMLLPLRRVTVEA